MAQHDRFTVLNAMFDVGVVPVFYHEDPATTISVVEACAEGGARARARARAFFRVRSSRNIRVS